MCKSAQFYKDFMNEAQRISGITDVFKLFYNSSVIVVVILR